MDDPPSPSNASSPSRRGSHINTVVRGTPPHPKHVDYPKDDRASFTDRIKNSFDWRSKKSMDGSKDEANEHSPLMGPRESAEVGELPPYETALTPPSRDESDNADDRSQETKSSWYLFLLTFALGGLQIAWSVELSNGSPYLLGLGISKSLLAIVWIAGPLSGTLVQPYVGIRSDRCRSKWGKRRPFIVGGAAATIVSLMLLAWTREIVTGFLYIFGVSQDAKGVSTSAIVFAVLMIYVLDFSINVIQAGIRAFIVDNAPTHQQDDANAWASRITGVGNILGYLSGYANLPKYFWFFGDTQFKVLCVIASLALIITVSVSCLSIQERDPRLEGEPAFQRGGVLEFFKNVYFSMRKLPTQISRVCQVQFFAWIGWFPFLFYITTYIGEIYVEPYFAENPNMTPEEIDATWEHATRIGTFALLIFAITTFSSSVILPFIVASSYKAPITKQLETAMTPGAQQTPVTPSTLGASSANGYFGYNPANAASQHSLHSNRASRTPLKRFYANMPSVEIPWLTLRRAWMLSHLLFALLVFLTFFIHTTTGATILVAFIGLPWALTNWAPYALIAAEISKRDAIRRGLLRAPPTRDGELLASGEDPAEGADQAGVVLGIHNVAIAAPQVIATLVSSAIFKALQKPRGSTGDDSVAWVLRFGGLATLVAAWLTRRVGEEQG